MKYMIILTILNVAALSYAVELPGRRFSLEQQIAALKLGIQTNNEKLTNIRQDLLHMHIFIKHVYEDDSIEVLCGSIANATPITITDENEVDFKIASCLSSLTARDQWKVIELITDYFEMYTKLLKQQKKLTLFEQQLIDYKKLPIRNQIA